MMARPEPRGLQRQAGAVGLLAALFLIMAVLVMGQALLRQSASGANDSLLTHDGVTALFLAESGLERAAAELSAGAVTCDASLAGSWSYAGGTVVIADLGAGFSTDFDGSALASGRCRVRATGTSGLYGAQRTVEAIINTEGNLLGSANANFNDPTTSCPYATCTPTGWSLSPGGWDDNGGPDGTRAAYVHKPDPGPSEVTSAGQFAMTAFTITAPATLTMDFDYRLDTSGGGGQRIELTMRLVSGATEYAGTPTPFISSHTGAFVPGSITFSIPGSGPVTIDSFEFELVAKSGQPKEAWLDNLYLYGSGTGSARVERWREIIN